jgi:hypothetical protein
VAVVLRQAVREVIREVAAPAAVQRAEDTEVDKNTPRAKATLPAFRVLRLQEAITPGKARPQQRPKVPETNMLLRAVWAAKSVKAV